MNVWTHACSSEAATNTLSVTNKHDAGFIFLLSLLSFICSEEDNRKCSSQWWFHLTSCHRGEGQNSTAEAMTEISHCNSDIYSQC